MPAQLTARRHNVEVGDAIEFCFAQGWTDGLPVVPPTADRVARMLEGARLDPKQEIGFVAHRGVSITAEKVAISSLGFDREEKASLYAQSGVPDSWILDVDGRRMEVRRNPRIDREAPSGWRHGAVRELGPDDQIVPLSAPGAAIGVAALLPGPR